MFFLVSWAKPVLLWPFPLVLLLQCPIGFGWRRWWHPTPVLLTGKSHGQRCLVGCSPWGCEESDTTERLHFHFSLSCTGKGNGNPLQCSCLENPRNGRAWWAAICGVTQSRTQLKQLSSCNSIGFGLLCFHFLSFLCTFWFLFLFLLWFVGYSAECFSASVCWDF